MLGTDYKCRLPHFKRTDCLSIQEARQKSGWAIDALNLAKAWEHTQGENVVIGVIDTGVAINHPDLRDNLLPGINFVKPGKPPEDDHGHGTHVTGILVAENNDIGMVGVCPKAKVRPIKALDSRGNGNLLNVALSVRWATEQKVDIITMSLGSPVPVKQVWQAIVQAANAGIPTFVAAGNAGKKVFYPAAYDETISVGAIDEKFKRADFSNWGEGLDFMAPGVDIFSTVPDDWYATFSGTSMACPFAVGVAALMLSYVKSGRTNVALNTVEDWRNTLRQYTTPINGKYENPELYEGYGFIDPRKFIP